MTGPFTEVHCAHNRFISIVCTYSHTLISDKNKTNLSVIDETAGLSSRTNFTTKVESCHGRHNALQHKQLTNKNICLTILKSTCSNSNSNRGSAEVSRFRHILYIGTDWRHSVTCDQHLQPATSCFCSIIAARIGSDSHMTEGDITTWVTDRSVFSSDVIPALIDIKKHFTSSFENLVGKVGKVG